MSVTNEVIFLVYVTSTASALVGAALLGVEAIIALISLEWVLANFFVTKQVVLFGFQATASDALAVGAMLGLNLLQEYKGKGYARQAINIGFFCLFFYVLVSILHLLYQPAAEDVMHVHFLHLLGPLPRIVMASLITYIVVQYLEYKLYSFLQARFGTHYFVARNYVSLSISQLVDTVLFSFLGLFGVVERIGEIIIVSYGIKMVTVILSVPLVSIMKKYIRDRLHHRAT